MWLCGVWLLCCWSRLVVILSGLCKVVLMKLCRWVVCLRLIGCCVVLL